MKNRLNKIIAVVLMITILTGVLPFSGMNLSSLKAEASYDNEETYPLEIEVIPNKDKYGVLETATINVCITNVGDNVIRNMNAICDFEGLQPVGKENTLCIRDEILNPDEQISYSFQVVIEKSNLNFFMYFLMLIKSLFVPFADVPYLDVNDNKFNTYKLFLTRFGNVDIENVIDVWFDYDTEIIVAETTDDFSKETSKLVNATMSAPEFNVDEAVENPYSAARVIVQSSEDVDFSMYAADTIVTDGEGTTILQFGNGAMAKSCVESLNKQTAVDFAEPDILIAAEPIGNIMILDKTSSNTFSWGKQYIKADSYEHYLENNNYFDMVTVAVVDTGVDLDHAFFKNRIAANGFDYIDKDSVADDENGHGTHVAGVIVECTNGLNVKILPVRVLNAQGAGFSSVIGNGIRYAANNGADVINLSLGGGKSNYIDSAVEYAVKEKEAIVCAAAGNGDERNRPVDTQNVSPANCEDAIVVGAIDKNGKVASFSNYGSSVDVVAPGVEVFSAYKNGSYASLSGTSMATPHIAATAAMFKLANKTLSPKEIESLIKDYCDDLGDVGRDNYYGDGTVNLYNAIPDCIVKFDTNGGTTINNKKVKSTDEITLPVPRKTYTVKYNANGGSVSQSVYTANCKLEGWYKSSSLTGIRYAPDELYMVKSNQVLYAKWENPKLGEVGFIIPTRTNYTFLGWYPSVFGGTKYTSDSEITGDITLYARWEQDTRQILDYNNWDVNSAISSLTSLGMKYTTSYAYNNNYASGKVYGQSVAANSKIPVGSTVTLYVSSGPRQIAVGDYIHYRGGTTLYKTIAGGLKDGVYKPSEAWGYCTGIYTYNGTVYYQFQYEGASDPFGWAPTSYFEFA